jgi:hypothetical protein
LVNSLNLQQWKNLNLKNKFSNEKPRPQTNSKRFWYSSRRLAR